MNAANNGAKQELGYRVQPHLFLLDPQGNILEQWRDPVSRQQLVDAFKAALQGSQ